jgi:hypothetical protein
MTLTRGRLIGCYEFDGMVVLFLIATRGGPRSRMPSHRRIC